MSKRYAVLTHSKHYYLRFKTNSYRIAKWLADLNVWEYAKIHDNSVDSYYSKCIYINDRRESQK